MAELETDRLLMREVLASDADDFLRYRQQEDYWRHVPIEPPIGQALLRLAFDSLSLHRVFAQCRVENQASRRIMAKLGMREEGVLRENVFARGEWWSSAQSSILSSEWDAVAKAK